MPFFTKPRETLSEMGCLIATLLIVAGVMALFIGVIFGVMGAIFHFQAFVRRWNYWEILGVVIFLGVVFALVGTAWDRDSKREGHPQRVAKLNRCIHKLKRCIHQLKRPAQWLLGLTVLWVTGWAVDYLSIILAHPKTNMPHQAICYTRSSLKGFHCYASLVHSWSSASAVLSALVIVGAVAGISVWLFWFLFLRDEVQKLRWDVERMNKGGPTNDELERKREEAADEAERNRPRTLEEDMEQMRRDERYGRSEWP